MRGRVILGLAVVASLPYFVAATPGDTVRDPVVHEVKMVDVSATEYKFEPADITVKRGDIIKWVQTVTTPHNVELRAGPDGEVPSVENPMGPFLTEVDAIYEITIDDAFATGATKYVCTPHEFMGMVGSITVED